MLSRLFRMAIARPRARAMRAAAATRSRLTSRNLTTTALVDDEPWRVGQDELWSTPYSGRARDGHRVYFFQQPLRLGLFHDAATTAALACRVSLAHAYRWVEASSFFTDPRTAWPVHPHSEPIGHRMNASTLAEDAIGKGHRIQCWCYFQSQWTCACV